MKCFKDILDMIMNKNMCLYDNMPYLTNHNLKLDFFLKGHITISFTNTYVIVDWCYQTKENNNI